VDRKALAARHAVHIGKERVNVPYLRMRLQKTLQFGNRRPGSCGGATSSHGAFHRFTGTPGKLSDAAALSKFG
jgi:hypothetical protein